MTFVKQRCTIFFVHVYAKQINVMLKELPEEEFGPGINFREYSFLENPLLPKQVSINCTCYGNC